MADTVLRVRVNQSTRDEVLKIAARERRLQQDVARMLLSSGLKQYRRKNSLVCGYEGCTRKDCCGGENGKLVMFPHIEAPPDEEVIVIRPAPPVGRWSFDPARTLVRDAASLARATGNMQMECYLNRLVQRYDALERAADEDPVLDKHIGDVIRAIPVA